MKLDMVLNPFILGKSRKIALNVICFPCYFHTASHFKAEKYLSNFEFIA